MERRWLLGHVKVLGVLLLVVGCLYFTSLTANAKEKEEEIFFLTGSDEELEYLEDAGTSEFWAGKKLPEDSPRVCCGDKPYYIYKFELGRGAKADLEAEMWGEYLIEVSTNEKDWTAIIDAGVLGCPLPIGNQGVYSASITEFFKKSTVVYIRFADSGPQTAG